MLDSVSERALQLAALMARMRDRFRRRATIGFLVALLLVPVALSAHNHASEASSTHPCAACTVTHHLPILSTAGAAPLVVAVVCTAAGAPRFVAPSRVDRAPRIGRAPPSFPAALA
jgi:hypothetical protein